MLGSQEGRGLTWCHKNELTGLGLGPHDMELGPKGMKRTDMELYKL